ncbi:N-acetyl sugar amidotransferase [Mucilaginibacter ginkgonis]|uniref:N-acetyl sugar amidotransferase n=1 Tax=Mucilaginibacter ginkgonis TaxID=2682091 RepID=A0A7T7FCJ4_9SPHI|nr:N-acetyl sugar amidotransferase [Mucilaginibacter ginkgonis]QQL50851.1 N-acetyl sugar amidotransferase [Mucilaginibacter ginkgonis]
MDTSDSEIVFDKDGVCNHVALYQEAIDKLLVPPHEREERLKELVTKIKADGRDQQYDCIIGLSGGIDSSYVAYLVKKLGLRPLAIHLDNGWNSELAVRNIERIVKKLDLDLYTYVINWQEFKELQLAFLKASVVDIEMLTDNAIGVIINKLAKQFKIKYYLVGTNVTSEAIMPRTWLYNIKYDTLNIKAIYKKFGRGVKIPSFPLFKFIPFIIYRYITGTSRFKKFGFLARIKSISLLNYIDYDKEQAADFLVKEINYTKYAGKHYESNFTKFYQAYILPQKFGIDKRRAFYSCLILSGQMTREQALEDIKKPLYSDYEREEEIEYICKKFGITREEFDNIMNDKPKSHYDYLSYDGIHHKIMSFLR